MSNAKSDSFDIGFLLKNLKSKWYLIVLSITIGYFAAKAYLRYQENIYSVNTTLLLTNQNSSVRSLGGLDILGRGGSGDINDEIQLMKSTSMIRKVLEELQFEISYYHTGSIRTIEFYNNGPIKVIPDTSSYQLSGVDFTIKILNGNKYRIKVNSAGGKIYDLNNHKVLGSAPLAKIDTVVDFGQVIKTPHFGFSILLNNPHFNKNDEGKLFFKFNDIETLARQFKHRFNIAPISKSSNILNLSMAGPVPQKNVDFLNKYCAVFIAESLEEKNRIVSNTLDFIDNQLGKISDSLKSSEKEIEHFRTTNRVMDLGLTFTAANDKLKMLEEQKSGMLLKIQYYEYVLDYISNNKDIKDIVAPSSLGIEDKILGGLIGDLIKFKTERSLLLTKTSANNPYIKELDRKIETTTQTVFESVRNIIEVSNIPIKDLNQRIAEIEKSLGSLPEKDRLWLDIQRRFNLNNHLYNFLLERRAEAGITKASTKPDHKIIEKAEPVLAFIIAPKASSIYNIFIFFSLIIPLAGIILFAYLNDKVQSKEDLVKRTSVPVLGMVGHKMINSNLVINEKPKSLIAEAFRSLRINLSYLSPDVDRKIISVTSSISGEGKTFLSVNLANILALTEKRVLLIGADLRRPKIFNDFGLTNHLGLSTYLSGKSTLEAVINKSLVPNLDIILSGPVPPNPSELLTSKKMQDLFKILAKDYDFIVIDTPPVGLVSDGLHLMAYADINIFVVRHNYTRYKMLEKLDFLKDQAKLKNLYMVINDIKSKDSAYYGYGYGNGYGYGGGYYEEDKPESTYKSISNVFKRSKA